MTELRNEAPLSCVPSVASDQRSSAPPEGGTIVPAHRTIEAPSGAVGGAFVADCTLESDLEMYFPDQYVPNDSERILLYRELDNIKDDKELEAFHERMVDRFGKMPPVVRELLNVVPLRRLGKQLGCEKIMLKQGRMFLNFD